IAKNSQALIYQFPRVTLDNGGNPVASGKNTDGMASFGFTASIDTTLLNVTAWFDRVEYFEGFLRIARKYSYSPTGLVAGTQVGACGEIQRRAEHCAPPNSFRNTPTNGSKTC